MKQPEQEPKPEQLNEKLKKKLGATLQSKNRLKAKLRDARKKIQRLKRERVLLLDRLEVYAGSDSVESDDPYSDVELSGSDLDTDGSSDSFESGTQAFLSSMSKPAKERFKERDLVREKEREREKDKDGKDKERDKDKDKDSDREKERAQDDDDASRKNAARPVKKIPPIPMGLDGKPILPMKLGIVTLVNLGTIIWENPAFHNQRYIWPVGFEAIRPYASTKYPDKNANYTCRIKNVDGAPRFEVVGDDNPEMVFSQTTATGAWACVLKEANRIRNKESANSVSGPDYFGFSNPIAMKLIQDLPNASKCTNYTWQEFVTTEMVPPKKRGGGKADRGDEDSAYGDDADDLNVDE